MKALAAVLKQDRVIEMDVGEMIRAGRRRRFAVSAGIGFDAAVCHEVCVSRWESSAEQAESWKTQLRGGGSGSARPQPAGKCMRYGGRQHAI